jgi:hypothetical protein
MTLSAKAVAAMATAVLGTATAMAIPSTAHASTIGPIFLYRHNAGVKLNCAGGNRELKNDGDVNITRDVYAHGAVHSSIQGDFQTFTWQEYSATRAVKEYWCYKGSYYNQYYAANGFSRTNRQRWLCSNGQGLGNCGTFLGSSATAWKKI